MLGPLSPPRHHHQNLNQPHFYSSLLSVLPAYTLVPLETIPHTASRESLLKCQSDCVIPLLSTMTPSHSIKMQASQRPYMIWFHSLFASSAPTIIVSLFPASWILQAYSHLKAFVLATSYAWNSLPQNIWMVCSLISFKYIPKCLHMGGAVPDHSSFFFFNF